MSTNTGEAQMINWEEVYYAQVEDTQAIKGQLLGIYDQKVAEELGKELYHEYKDLIVVSELTSILDDLEKPDWDTHETPDNKARDISSLYQVISYYMRPSHYKKFVEGRRSVKTKEDH
jgi:hypothetical protein